MNRCAHFTGVQNDTCAAGVAYASVRPSTGGGLPCFRDDMGGGECSLMKFPTREEAEKKAAEDEAATARVLLAVRAAHEDAKAKRFGKGHGGADSVACPVCQTGQLFYRVAGYNGHMHAKCETDGCVQWME